MQFSSLDVPAVVMLEHFEELRRAINAARAAYGSAPLSWSDLSAEAPPPAVGGLPARVHLLALRASMDQALRAAGVAVTTPFADPSPTIFMKIHLQQLRERVQ
jgi:hypothetical protein